VKGSPGDLGPLLRRAAAIYKDPRYADLYQLHYGAVPRRRRAGSNCCVDAASPYGLDARGP
jgi:hypothetical protein